MLSDLIEYVENLLRFDDFPSLDSFKRLMESFGNPQDKFKTIHVTGTNGKGSTSTMVASILKESRYKTGLYISPYVTSFNERVQINNKYISDEDLERLIQKVKAKCQELNLPLKFFEFITAIAFLYFEEKKIDITVVEVGMGGRHDPTNVITSLVSVITNISLDHESVLGFTKEKIAKEKSSIIKENQFCISGEEDNKIRSIISQECEDKNTKLVFASDAITFMNKEKNLDYQSFSTQGLIKDDFKIKLLGDHQIKNAIMAILVSNYLKEKFSKININSIKTGLEKAFIPGRLQIISKEPIIILDGAHNPDGAKSLSLFLKEHPNLGTLIVGIADTKNSELMLSYLCPLFKKIIITEGDYKPKKAEVLAEEARLFNNNVVIEKDSHVALDKAIGLTEKGDSIIVTGSLYLISKFLKNMPQITTIV